MEIVSINGTRAICQYKGIERDVDLFLLLNESLTIGDYVVVHVGYALSKLTPTEASEALTIFDEIEGMEHHA